MKTVAYKGIYFGLHVEESNDLNRTFVQVEIQPAGGNQQEKIGVSFKNEDNKNS